MCFAVFEIDLVLVVAARRLEFFAVLHDDARETSEIVASRQQPRDFDSDARRVRRGRERMLSEAIDGGEKRRGGRRGRGRAFSLRRRERVIDVIITIIVVEVERV